LQHDQAKKSWVDPENMNYTSISTASVSCGSVSYLSIPISETISAELRVVSIFRIAVDAISCPFVTLLNNHFVVLNAERCHATKHSFAYDSIVTEVRIIVASGLAWAVAIIPLMEDFWPGNIQNVTKISSSLYAVYLSCVSRLFERFYIQGGPPQRKLNKLLLIAFL